MASDAEAEASETKKAPWNSLEVAKLLMAAATPLAIFLLGVAVSQSAEEQRTKRENEARTKLEQQENASRDAARRAQAAAREEARRDAEFAREEARRDAQQASQQAFVRERALRAESDQRATLLRRESDLREAHLRSEAAVESRRNRLLDRRLELWERAAPDAATAHDAAAQIVRANQVGQDLAMLRRDLVRSLSSYEAALAPYDGFFSTRFNTIRREFRMAVTGFITALDNGGQMADAYQLVDTSYRELMSVVRVELTEAQSL
jgi:hypothetical protein